MKPPRQPRAIYLLASRPYPAVSGGKRRAANIAEALSEHFALTVIAADDPAGAPGAWAAASGRFVRRRHSRRALLADSVEGVVRGWPVFLVRSVRAGLPEAFRLVVEAERPDLVLLGRPLLAPYTQVAKAAGARVIIDADESMPKVAWAVARSRHAPPRQRARALVEAVAILGRLERSAYPRADQVWVSSQREQEGLSGTLRTGRLRVIPNAIDVPDTQPDVVPVNAVAFVGWYRYPPNEAAALELVREVMPAIRAAGGTRSLILIGPEPTQAMLKAATGIREIAILGEVLEVRSHLRSAGVLVVPVRSGGGTRVKILEAMAAGVPVVSTSLGIEGLDLRPETDVLVAETPSEFGVQVARLAADVGLRARLTRNAFEQVRTAHSIEVLSRAVTSALGSTDPR